MGQRIKLAHYCGATHIILEFDSSVAVDYINGSIVRCPWSLKILLIDIKEAIKYFTVSNITYVNREANCCAQDMAQSGLRLLHKGSGGFRWSLQGSSSVV